VAEAIGHGQRRVVAAMPSLELPLKIGAPYPVEYTDQGRGFAGVADVPPIVLLGRQVVAAQEVAHDRACRPRPMHMALLQDR
jgi:hypothetical protein